MPLSLMRSAAPESFLVGIMSQILEFDNGPHTVGNCFPFL